MTTEIWQHMTSGERFVVTTNQDGTVISAAGPLHYSEVEAALSGNFDSDPELVDWFNNIDEGFQSFSANDLEE